MNSKAPRTKWENSDPDEKLRYIKRIQEDRETKRSLRDFLEHIKEDEQDFPDSDAHGRSQSSYP
jgi:hypothetical protein